MKSDKLEVPQINLQLRNIMEILQMGGRITRSKKNPTSKTSQSRGKEKQKTLLKFIGEPNLQKYLANTTIKYNQFLTDQYLPNKKMKRLNKHNLPENCIYFEKLYNSCRVKSVKFHAKKSKIQEFLIQQRDNQRQSVVRSLSSQEDTGILTTVQTIVLVFIRYEDFVKLFKSNLNDIKRNYQAMKVEQLQKMQEQRVESQPNISSMIEQKQGSENAGMAENQIYNQNMCMNQNPNISQNQSKKIIENVNQNAIIGQNAQSNKFLSLDSNKPPSLDDIQRQSNQHQTPQYVQIINRDIPDLERAIFNKLSIPKLQGILWPATVLQPIYGERSDLQKLIPATSQIQKQELKNQKAVMRLDQKILQTAFMELIQQNTQESSDKVLQSKQKIQAVDNKQKLQAINVALVKKIQFLIQKVNKSSQDNLFLNLIGTIETIITKSNFFKWQELTYEQLQIILLRSPMRILVNEINNYIQCLNNFKNLEDSPIDNTKISFFRICKYQNQSGEFDLCIPIRIDQTKEEKKVLVRFLKQNSIQDNQLDLLSWIDSSKLRINLTLPKHNDIQKKFYYLLGNLISIEQGINYMYSDYYYLPCNFNSVLRICYPQNQLKRVFPKQQRCIYCYYKIQASPYFRCKFCLQFSHDQCTNKTKIANFDQNKHNPIDIFQTDNDDEVWNCQECSPCTQCQMPVKKDFLKCNTCKNVFHGICGKLKGMQDSMVTPDKYTCQNCLKCKMCSSKLKNLQYFIEQKNTFCMKCYKDFKNNQYCIICMKQVPNKLWVQCDQTNCNKWIHISCDTYFKQKQNKQTVQKSNYRCPVCRQKERRKVFKWTIQQLKFFDQYQFFYQPEYEEIIGYKEAIKNPICIFAMRQKSIEGKYDENPYLLIKADLDLLVKNAMTFNMPKDQAHYRAKILQIVGSKFLISVKDLLESNQQVLVNEDLQMVFAMRKKAFYTDIYEHLLDYLLNYGSQRAVIQVKRQNNIPSQQQQYFSTKIILNRSFANAEFKFKIKKKPHRIQNLFTIPRLSNAAWWPIRIKNCYYHPDQTNPIIFQCLQCWESYCCTKICFKHRICGVCNQRGCGCDLYQCKCPPLKDKDRKNFQSKISSTLSQSKLQKKQYTQYFKYCLKCVVQNLKSNWCYICLGFCYYAYERCIDCSKFYHIGCEKKNRWDEMSIFYQNKHAYKNSYENARLPKMCFVCSYSVKNAQSLKQHLTAEIKKKASKIQKINKYICVFVYLYEHYGIRLTVHQIINLISQNYQQFLQRETFFSQFLSNFSLILQHVGNNKIAREQFRDYYNGEISRKLSSQTQHQKYISFVETKQIKQLKLSKKFFKIFSKHFNNLYFPVNFLNSYEIKYHLQHLTSKMNHQGVFGINLSYQYHISDQQFVATNFREESHLNFKNFERIKIQAITSYVSPKSKKNIYYTSKLQKYKNYLNFWLNYYQYKKIKFSNNNKHDRSMISEQDEKIVKEYQKYLRYHSDHQNLTDCIYKQQSSKSLLSQPSHTQNFNPFYQNNSIVKYNKLVTHKQKDANYTNNKSQMISKYLSNFALKIFQQNKVVLKKGSTCILSESKKCWRISKRFGARSVEIKLQKLDQWYLFINEWRGLVRSIDDIIRKLKQLVPIIQSFQDVAEFMGFSMVDTTYYEPNHFTHLLQTTPLDQFNRKQRKREVLKVYDKYQWHRQGNFSLYSEQPDGNTVKYDYNVTKKQLFYLKKRNAPSDEETVIQPRVIPFITFQDIKKDLQDSIATSSIKQKQHFAIKDPTYDVYIAPSKIDRLGLFISKFTKKHTIVAEYIGEVVSEAMADVRQEKFHFGCYMFGLSKNNTRQQIIDATFIGNMARYLNHSCDPNCKARIQMVNGQPRIFIYTLKDVKQNQQLTYDYQFKIDTNQRLICKCKAKNCQGRLT